MIRTECENKDKRTRFHVLLAGLFVLLLVRYGFQLDIPRIMLTAIVALIALLGDRDEILAMAMCCIPLHEAIDFFYALVACAGIYILKYFYEVRINFAIVLVLVMVLWELMHCITASFSMMAFLVSMIPLLFMAMILSVDVSNIDYGFITRSMAMAVAAMCLSLLTNLVVRADLNIMVAIAGLRRLGLASEQGGVLGGALNPNTLGVICVLAATGLLQLRSVENSKIFDIFLIVLLLVFGTLTSSRTFLVCFLLMVLLFIMGQPGDLRKKLRFIGVMLLLGIFAWLLLKRIFPEVLQYYMLRFQGTDITTGRVDLMKDYHRYIIENVDVMSFGVGIQDLTKKLVVNNRVSFNLPHNGVQEIIVVWGVPGLILFVLMCILMVTQSGKYCKRHNILNFIPFAMILTKSMAGQLITSNYTLLALGYAYLSLCQDFRLIQKK